MSLEKPKKLAKDEEPVTWPVEPIRQPYHYPRGPEIREPGDVLARNLVIAGCIGMTIVLVVLLYFMAHGRFP